MNIKQVANRAGVSASTVSRAINRPQMVDVQTAERIRQVIQEFNYVPNGQASSLSFRENQNVWSDHFRYFEPVFS